VNRLFFPCMLLVMSLINQAAFSGDLMTPQTLAGTWQCVAATNAGQPLAEEKAKQLRLTLTTERFKTQLGEQVLFDSTYTIDAAKNPVQIEMIGTEGDLKGKPAIGIIKLDGERLTLCYVYPGYERPIAFESLSGSRATLTVWKRAEKQ
jgi:uncharacterized protein (TIGR03067 family)